ncbi:MAG TPA: hypothetical protein VFZ59_04940 [Verrucomicrobiae bacterium]|nr:hypothetical protein [Verrucomicrobiae bacterium]
MKKLRRILWLLALVAVMGCATNRIDWNARVGTYTYEDAVVELGPPDKQEKLTDGTIVAEWLTQRGRTAYVGGTGYYYGYPGRGYYGPSYIQGAPDYFIRLMFDPSGKLVSWKKLAR